jgi:hypothetical protein
LALGRPPLKSPPVSTCWPTFAAAAPATPRPRAMKPPSSRLLRSSSLPRAARCALALLTTARAGATARAVSAPPGSTLGGNRGDGEGRGEGRGDASCPPGGGGAVPGAVEYGGSGSSGAASASASSPSGTAAPARSAVAPVCAVPPGACTSVAAAAAAAAAACWWAARMAFRSARASAKRPVRPYASARRSATTKSRGSPSST